MPQEEALTLTKTADALENQNEDAGKSHVVYAPVVATDGLIAEQVYSPGFQRTWFLVRRFDSENIEREDEIRVELNDDFAGDEREIIYRPLENETLRKRLVLLPDGLKRCTFSQAYETGCELALELYDTEPSKVDEVKFLVGVAQSSWFLDRWFPNPRLKVPGMGGFAPIIPLRGMPGSGKDRLLNALRLNSYRPFYDVATIRAPSLYRPLDQWKGTLCMSEADFRFSTESSEVMKYLNCRSYGVPYSRQNPDKSRYNDVFESFGLTVVTQRRVWEDNAAEDRSLPFYCEKSQKPIPTEELDEWIERGIDLMDMLLYLRLSHWEKVIIDKTARIEGVRDHRLTAAVLPLLAISKLELSFAGNFIEVLKSMERKRKEVKAMSRDGLVVTLLWDKIHDGSVGSKNGLLYIGKEREKADDEVLVVPLTTSDIADVLKWTTKDVRSILQSLQLNINATREQIRVGTKKYRPIWFSSHRLQARFADYVVDYDPAVLTDAIKGVSSVVLGTLVPLVPDDTKERVGMESGTFGTSGTDSNQGSGTRHVPAEELRNPVPDVPHVPDSHPEDGKQ